MTPELIGIPYTSAAAPGGIANAIGALREAGLPGRVPGLLDLGDLELVSGDGVRGHSGLLHEGGLSHLAAATYHAVSRSLRRGGFPIVVGGDCPVLLGALAAGREQNRTAGLLFVDGHEDAWLGVESTTGEASDSEVAIALGRIGDLPEPLDHWVPLLTPDRLVMLGPRDREEIEGAGVRTLADTVVMFRDDEAVHAAGAESSAREAIETLAGSADVFWLHIDLDVLRTEDFPAADYTQPGGLTWTELLQISTTAVAAPGCFGCSVAIYNPDLDPDRTSADRVVRFLGDLVASTSA